MDSSLQHQNLRHIIKYHIIKYERDNKVAAILWAYLWCEMMWRRFPQVLGLDNTYMTNRFNLYLFQVTGVTDQQPVANFAFGLINTEKEESFQWLCNHVDDFRKALGIPLPSVILTDKEMALKNARSHTFPLAQQQLCVYQINANIHTKVFSRWKNSAD